MQERVVYDPISGHAMFQPFLRFWPRHKRLDHMPHLIRVSTLLEILD